MEIEQINSFYRKLKRQGKGYFIGDFTIARSLMYCLPELSLEAWDGKMGPDIYVIREKPEDCQVEGQMSGENAHIIDLKDFVKILDIQKEDGGGRKYVYWGCGNELDMQFEALQKIYPPKFVIDKEKTGVYRGIPIRKFDDSIRAGEYFVIITAFRCKQEIKEVLLQAGYKEHQDFDEYRILMLLGDCSEMFLKTVYDRRLRHCSCSRPFDYVNVGVGGYATHCCFQWLPHYIGNIMDKGDNPLDTIKSRIIRLSFLNGTYSFCNTLLCHLMNREREELYEEKAAPVEFPDIPFQIKEADMAFDSTCNLYCASCRERILVECGSENMEIADQVQKKLLPQLSRLTVAGNGEAFFSPAYRKLLTEGKWKQLNVNILSNGNLFEPQRWKEVEGRFKSVALHFSVDAATEETYRIVRRGGNWERLMNNLRYASELRKKGNVCDFGLRFVVSSLNYREIPAFVRLGNGLGVDWVDFSRIENWGTCTPEEFSKLSMFHGSEMKQELKEVLKDPVMKSPKVRLFNL